MKYTSLIVILLLIITRCDTQAATSKKATCFLADTTLKSRLLFPIGAAIKIKPLRNNLRYRNTVIREFSSITAENAMKFKALHPSKDTFEWSDADEIVQFALSHKMRVHGHTLNWPKNNPKWVMEFEGDSTAWENMLKLHIQTVVKHFKGKVTSWDVVNEAFNDNGTFRQSIWLEKLGQGYLARCFQYAHEADPEALLFYNDYGQEYGGKKMKAILNWVTKLQNDKIPIDGLGFQLHTSLRIPIKSLQDNINAAVHTGLLLHISELDISVRGKKGDPFTPDSTLAINQALKYKQIFLAYGTIPVKQQFGITLWGVGDKDSYRNAKSANNDFPLLFDKDYQPKPAYKAILTSAH